MIYTLHKIYSLLEKNEKSQFFKLSILMILASLLETLGIASIFPLINTLSGEGTSLGFLNNLNYSFIKNPNSTISLIIIIFIIYFIKNIYLCAFYWYENKFAYNTRFNLGYRLFNIYLKLPLNFHRENNSSSLITKIVQETALYGGSLMSLSSLVTELLILSGITILLLLVKPFETVCVLLIILFFSFVFYIFSKKITLNLGQLLLTSQKQKMKVLNESLKSVQEISVFGARNYFSKIFKNKSMDVSRLGYKMSFINRLPKIWFETGAILIISFIVIYSSSQESSNSEIMATLGIFLLSALKIIPSINKILISLQTIRYSKPAVESINKDISKVFAKEKFLDKSNNKEKISFEKSITFKDVSLKFENKPHNILENINFKINKKDFIAIIGKTGSGKTSFLNLLMGLIKPSSGNIFIDQFRLNDYLSSWRKKIGFVPQNINLLEDSLEKNVAYGLGDDLISEEKVKYSLKLSKLSYFIKKKDENLFIGEDGGKISGGEKQRLAIARALYHEPEVLIFDEPTSALDADTAKDLFETLKELNLKKTIIVVSHNTKYLEKFDKVFEIKEKKILQTK